MQIPKLPLEEDKLASYEIMMYYRDPEQKHEHGDLIDYFFSDLIKEVFNKKFNWDEFLFSKTEDEQIIVKKLLQITLEKNEDNESGYFGVKKSYDFDGDNWHYIDEIKAYFNCIIFFHAETLNELKDEVTKNNCPWLIVDETLATKSRITDAKLRREKENAYDEENYEESLEIHPRYATKFIKEYYESTSKYDDLIRKIFSKNCLNAIYNNTIDIDQFLNSDNPMERAIVRLLIPFINNKLHSDVKLNDTGIFGVKTTYDENGNNWIYDDELRNYFNNASRIYAKTLGELKRKVIKNKGIWFVLDDDLKNRSVRRDKEIQDENNSFKNSASQLRKHAKDIIKKSFSTDTDSYSKLVRDIHTSEVMESIVDKTLNIDILLYSSDMIGRILLRMSIQKMKDALLFARMNNYMTGYFGVIHPEYKNWSYVNLVEREYFGWDDFDVIYASSLRELEKKVKSNKGNIWCIFDGEKAESVHEIDRILINSQNPNSISSISDYWDSLSYSPLNREINAEYIEDLIERNKKRESFLLMKEEEKIRWEKIKQLEKEFDMNKYKMNSDIKKILRN